MIDYDICSCSALVFSPDGTQLCCGFEDGVVSLWRVGGGYSGAEQCVWSTKCGGEMVSSLALRPADLRRQEEQKRRELAISATFNK